MLSEYRREAAENQSVCIRENDLKSEDFEEKSVFWCSVENESQLKSLESIPEITGIYLPVSLYVGEDFCKKTSAMLKRLQSKGKRVGLSLPYITRNGENNVYAPHLQALSAAGLDRILVRCLEDFALLKKLDLVHLAVLDAGIYTMNRYALDFWKQQGVRCNTVPLELNQKEICRRDNRDSELILYGRTPMMISA